MKYLIGFIIGAGYVFFLTINLNHGRMIDGNTIPDINKKVKNINNGGCGYFALNLYRRLDHKKYDIVSIDTMRHFAIREKETGFYIDAAGFHSQMSFRLQNDWRTFDPISFDSLRKLVYRKDLWNSKFNWKDTILIDSFINGL